MTNPIHKKDVEIGARYVAKVSGNLVTVQITREHDRGGWIAMNLFTGREVRIKSAAKLRERKP